MIKYHKIDNLTEVQLAYFAGLLDGEGCVRVGKCKNLGGSVRYRAYMVIGMTDIRPIKWLKDTIGGNYCVGKRYTENSKICFSWQVNAKEGAALLRRALPYLIVKYEQAQNYIAFAETITGKGGQNTSKPIPNKLLKIRKQMFLVSKSLNRKGIAA